MKIFHHSVVIRAWLAGKERWRTMGTNQSKDHAIIAELNQHVHKVHVTLYPDYFKEYNFEVVRDFFRSIINNPTFIFLPNLMGFKKLNWITGQIIKWLVISTGSMVLPSIVSLFIKT
jgi:DNA integrity scanning protein DisA with diadenylate cyclase activity